MTTEQKHMPEQWTPNTHHSVPQPAGHLCADWYERDQPDASTILHALAHTKGLCDELAEALRQIAEDDNPSRPNADQPETEYEWAQRLMGIARAAIARKVVRSSKVDRETMRQESQVRFGHPNAMFKNGRWVQS